MVDPGHGSVSRWIEVLKTGDEAPISPLLERDFDRLVEVARQELRWTKPRRADEDEEDAALRRLP